MKKIALFSAAIGLIFSACKEKDLDIPELTVGKHRVMVEEVTGVNCVNCPDGARELAAIQQQVGAENLIIVSIHAGGNLSEPIQGSQYDFQFDEGYDYVNKIGTLFAVPSAAIDRVYNPIDETPFLIDGWAAKITSQLAIDYKLGLFVTNHYDEATRKLDINVNIAPEIEQSGPHRLTVLISQDSIVDAQYDGPVIVPNYMHRHVLRDVVTAVLGDEITEPLTANALITKTYSLTLDPKWDAKHCAVVAFVHRNGADNKEILQATEAHVTE